VFRRSAAARSRAQHRPGEQAHDAAVASRHRDSVGAEGPSTDRGLGHGPQYVAFGGTAADHEMGVDGHRPLTVPVGGEAHGAVSEGEHGAAVGQIEKVEVLGRDLHLELHPLLGRRQQADPEVAGVPVVVQQLPYPLNAHPPTVTHQPGSLTPMRPILLCLLAALVACGGQTSPTTTAPTPTVASTVPLDFDPADMVLYESSAFGFSIAHPPDWLVTEVAVENLVGFTAPSSSSDLTPNFNVTANHVGEDFPPIAYYQGEIDRLQTSLENAEILEVADVKVDGVIGRGFTLVTNQAGRDIGISRVIVVNDGTAYELSFFAEARDLERLAPMVSAIFQSLRFTD
jgi:hypothetical protein